MKNYHRIFMVGIILIITTSSFLNCTTFEKWYGYQYDDVGYDVLLDYSEGYLVAGHLTPDGEFFTDGFFMKTDTLGDTTFLQTYGGNLNDGFRSFVRTPDGGFLFAGFTNSSGAGVNDAYLLKVDSLGDSLWSKTFGTTGFDAARKIIESNDGRYVMVGYTEDMSGSDRDIYLIKVDSLGNTVWEKTYGVTGTGYYEGGSSIIQTIDGGYLIAGFTNSYGAGMADGYLFKVDSLGDSLWAATYGGSYSDEFFSIIDCPDGGYAVIGFSDANGPGNPDIYFIRFDASNDSLWSALCGGVGIDRGFGICHTHDGSFGLIGHSEVGGGNFDVHFVKVDSLGNEVWSRAFGGNDIDDGYTVKQTSDSGFILVGLTRSYGAGYSDIYLIKTDSLGLGICGHQDPRQETRDLGLICHPNPFTSKVRIQISDIRRQKSEDRGQNFLRIYDVSGRLVREISLLPFSFLLGAKATWDGCDELGREVQGGVYFLMVDGRCFGKVVKVR